MVSSLCCVPRLRTASANEHERHAKAPPPAMHARRARWEHQTVQASGGAKGAAGGALLEEIGVRVQGEAGRLNRQEELVDLDL